MRTSGADSDMALFMMPVVVVLFLSVLWFGGPQALLRSIDATVLDGLRTVAGFFR